MFIITTQKSVKLIVMADSEAVIRFIIDMNGLSNNVFQLIHPIFNYLSNINKWNIITALYTRTTVPVYTDAPINRNVPTIRDVFYLVTEAFVCGRGE